MKNEINSALADIVEKEIWDVGRYFGTISKPAIEKLQEIVKTYKRLED